MKMEKDSRYQETEIVSYVQVINKAEIDRYLYSGKEVYKVQVEENG